MLMLQELDKVLKMLELALKTQENQHKLDLEMSIATLEEWVIRLMMLRKVLWVQLTVSKKVLIKLKVTSML